VLRSHGYGLRMAKDTDPVALEPLALNQADAARALGLSVNHFKQHVRPHVRAVYVGGLRRYPVAELQRWLEANAR
jgi:hypothetical protein